MTVTYPIQRESFGDCVSGYPFDTDCIAHVQELRPTFGVVVVVCVPMLHGEDPAP